MAKHGSLCQQIYQPRRKLSAVGIFCALLVAHLAASPAITGEDQAGGLIDARFRCQWDAKDARFWKVRLSVIDPTTQTRSISEVDNYSASDRTSGAFELSSDARVLSFQPRHAMLGGAVQLRVRASRAAKLVIEVLGDARNESLSGSQQSVKEVSLAEIIDGRTIESDSLSTSVSTELSRKPTWSLARIAGDELRIENIRDVPFYEPGSQLTFSVASNALVRHASQLLTLQYSLYRVSHGETVSSHRWKIKVDSRGNCEPITIDQLAPELPGVYEVRCHIANDDDNIWSRIRKRDPPLVHVAQPIVVLAKEPKSQASGGKVWRNVGEIRPSESSWSVGQWLPEQTTRLISGSDQKASQSLASQEYAGESISLIQPQNSFQATLPVMTPGLPHKVTIRFPAARVTRIRVDVAGSNDRAYPAVSFVLSSDPVMESADDWKTHTFVHYPTGDDQIWLTNVDTSSPAAFESITVHAGPSHLTSLSSPEAGQRSAMMRLPDFDWVDTLSVDATARSSITDCDRETIAMYKLWIASDRLRDYALANGMNGVMVPANSGARAWFDSASFFPRRVRSTHEGQRLAAFMHMMELSHLDVFVDVEPSMLLSDPEHSIRTTPTPSRELTRIHSGNGDQYNPLHPLVQESLASLVGEIYQQCSEYSCFAGIALQCDSPSHLQPLREASDDPGTLALFAQSEDKIVSPAHLRTWVEQQGKHAFETWLRKETGRSYQLIGRWAPNKPLLIVMQGLFDSAGRRDANAAQNQPLLEQWRTGATNLVPAQSFCYSPPRVLAKNALLDQQLASMQAPSATQAPSAKVAVILGENADNDSNEPGFIRDRLVADLSRIIEGLDPSMLIVELPLVANRLQADFAHLLRSFAAVPAGKMRQIDPIDPVMQTIHVSSRTRDGHLYVSMISLAPWTSELELESSAPVDWVQLGETSDSQNIVSNPETHGTRTRIVIPAGQLIAMKSKTATNAHIESWSARVSGGPEAIKQIKNEVTLIIERIGMLSDFKSCDTLTNGGFEQSGGMGLVGWLHAQHPKGCVRIDDKEFVEGKHSVLLTTDGASTTRTWIVSETIDPPPSGRLAVSLACRGELKEDDSVHRLKVSIEATRDGQPIRYSDEVVVPCNGRWGSREVVLEANGIEPTTVDSIRVTIDSLSRGRVWIDDVHLHDRFPTAKERADLQSQAFLAVKGLQSGNLTPSARLLQNHWARHLLTLGPPRPFGRVIKTVEPPEEAPSIAERIRSWLPRPLRF